MSGLWHYQIDGPPGGPISWRQLKLLADSNRLKPCNFVWKAGTKRKLRAYTIKGLFDRPIHRPESGVGPASSLLIDAQISMECARCGFEFKIAKKFIGRQGRCPSPSCGRTFVVPEPSCLLAEDSRDSIESDEMEFAEVPISKRLRHPKSPRLPTAKLYQQSFLRVGFGFLTRVEQPVYLLTLAGGLVLVLMALTIWSLSGTARHSGNMSSAAGTTALLPQQLQEDVFPLLRQYCADCHTGNEARGDFLLPQDSNESSIVAQRATWERLTDLITMGVMPPADTPQIPAGDKEKILSYADSVLLHASRSEDTDPGRVIVRRLNRFEYNNTIRDLLGINFEPADDFPSDDVGYGFDNIGEILSLSPLLMEKYLLAAEKIAATAVKSASNPSPNLPSPLASLITHHPRNGTHSVDCLQDNLRPLVNKAFRRSISDEEFNHVIAPSLMALERGESFEFAMQTALTAVLVSPHFLFRVESDEPSIESQNVRVLSGYELASRLSYFLWSSMPDEELLEHAALGDLQSDTVLAAQIDRMLRDGKSLALTESFAVQWLHLKSLDDAQPSPQQFPEYNLAVKEDLKQETKSFFAYVAQQDRSVLEFLDGQYTFLNERLASHYGIPGVVGNQFRQVSLTGTPRSGLLTHGSILTLTSFPTRTSPVKRGKWILEVMLDQPPPPPPPALPSLAQTTEDTTTTLRQRLEIHRSNPACISCHQVMDSLGFGMENFDPIGRWRTFDGQQPLDTTGQLPGGRSFRGPTELVAVLKERDTEFARALTSKLMTYALGRSLKRSDRPTVNSIVETLKAKDFRFAVLISEIVKSRPFRMRSVKGPES